MNTPEKPNETCWLQHALNVAYDKKYRAAYLFTILENETNKIAGLPLLKFDPKDPEAVFRENK